jgi:hypothetical protein
LKKMLIYDVSGKLLGNYIETISIMHPELSGFRKKSGDGPPYIDSSLVKDHIYKPLNW